MGNKTGLFWQVQSGDAFDLFELAGSRPGRKGTVFS